MNMNTDLKFDFELSKLFQSYLPSELEGACYLNIYTLIYYVINDEELLQNIKVAYGYIGEPDKAMYRHCFMVVGGNRVVDPTCVHMLSDKTKYHIFKLLDIDAYKKLIDEFYQVREKNEVPRMEGMIPEEKYYCDYLIKNNIGIEKDNYFEFLEKYDNDKKVRIVDLDIEAFLLFKKDNEGKVLTTNEVKLLKDGTVIWVELEFPAIMKKQGTFLISLVGEPLTYNLSDIDKSVVFREYTGDNVPVKENLN